MGGSRTPNDGPLQATWSARGRDWPICDDEGQALLDMSAPEGIALIVEQEIVPRLMLIHQTATAAGTVAERKRSGSFGVRAVRSFARLLLTGDAAKVTAYVIDRLKRGQAPSVLCLELLAPTADHIGKLWEEDTIDFVEVTLALRRLHALLEILRVPAEIEPGQGGRHILLVPTPGDSHIFGRAIVGEFFRAAGWLVEGELLETRAEIEDAVEKRMFAIVGFSLGSEVLCGDLRALIEKVRRGSLNQSVAILVGGPVFSATPARTSEVGADGWAANAKEAVALAETFVMRQQLATSGRR